MTVCVAAICQWYEKSDPIWAPMVVATSDRMLTAGYKDVEYEPPQPKMFALGGGKYGVLIAGDAAVHSWIIPRVVEYLQKNPSAPVADVADQYGLEMLEYFNRETERIILRPLGLTLDSFNAQQGTMAPQVVDGIVGRLNRYRLESEALVVGVDTQPHLYVVSDPGTVTCHDFVGFAAIGIGANHASASLMAARYARNWGFARALLGLYTAKKRAEIAPGVGTTTDVFYGDKDKSWFIIEEYDTKGVLKGLQSIHEKTDKALDAARGDAEKDVVEYVKKLSAAEATEDVAPQPAPQALPAVDKS